MSGAMLMRPELEKRLAAEVIERLAFIRHEPGVGTTLDRASIAEAAGVIVDRLLGEPAAEARPETLDPLRRFVPLYRTKAAGAHLGARAFAHQADAWAKPRGPHVPADLEILDVIEVRAVVPAGKREGGR